MSGTSKEEMKLKTKEEKLQKVVGTSKDLDEMLEKVVKLDNTCSFPSCKKKTTDFAISCKYCNSRFCTTHGLQEIHGCGEAVRRDERQKFLNPGGAKLSKANHDKAQQKLNMKMKQMELERKSKPSKGKKTWEAEQLFALLLFWFTC